jgi:phenylacetate-CoA ligase
MRLPDYVIDDPALITAPREQLLALQDERLRTMVRYVHARSPFWRAKLDQAGVHPDTFAGRADLQALPTCTKKELQADQEENGPLGSYVCSDRRDWARFFTTSGTTGRPLRRVFSARDWDQLLGRFHRAATWSPDDVLFLTAPMDALAGPTAGLEAASTAGALVISGGLWSTERKIKTIVDMRPTSISGSVSYILHLTEVAAGMGVDLSEVGVRSVSCVGEPGAAIEGTRQKISERFGGAVLADGYGMTEIFPLGGNCAHNRSVHLSEDMVLVECLEPGGDEPVAPGELGELVYTNLIGDTQPLIRYRSGDLGRLSDGSPCTCGHTHLRIEGSVEGRVDDMIWYRGTNFFPSAVEAVLATAHQVGREYQIVLTEVGGFPQLTVRVERTDGTGPDEEVRAQVAGALKNAVGVTADIEVLPNGALPRPQAGTKIKRVIDERKTPVLEGQR